MTASTYVVVPLPSTVPSSSAALRWKAGTSHPSNWHGRVLSYQPEIERTTRFYYAVETMKWLAG